MTRRLIICLAVLWMLLTGTAGWSGSIVMAADGVTNDSAMQTRQ